MGGIYEHHFQPIKKNLSVLIGRKIITSWHFMTLLAEIEAHINSRPLTTDSNDVAITPSHLLYGRIITQFPQKTFKPLPSELPSDSTLRLLWNKRQQRTRSFLERWRKDYFHTLLHRSKWHLPQEIPIGAVCIVVDESLKSDNRYALAKVLDKTTGRDGHTRSLRLLLPSGKVFTRPLNLVCPLEGHLT